jgi:hypothetical protein
VISDLRFRGERLAKFADYLNPDQGAGRELGDTGGPRDAITD